MAAGLTPEAILDVWERSRRSEPFDRAHHLRAALEPTAERDALLDEPIGCRDAALVRGRMGTFGSEAECFVECPRCGEPLELTVDLARLVDGIGPAPAAAGPHRVDGDSGTVTFRLPTTGDLAAVRDGPDPRAALLDRCVLAVEPGPDAPDPGALDVEALDAAMAELDPLADVQLALTCAPCGHAWTARFDIADHLWREVEAEARRLIAEVDALARAYGWSETAILALGADRRQSYLEALGLR
jgi:hypothetical protein